MKLSVSYNNDKGMFEVTARYSFENTAEIETAARQALRNSKIPPCVEFFELKSYRMTRYEANPLIADFFQRAGLNFSTDDVSRMDWASINELLRFVRASSVVIAL
jgi:hypothetical protein